MQKTEKIWINGGLVDWDKANTHILTHSLHYGSGVFEGIRVYKLTQKEKEEVGACPAESRLAGRSGVFRLDDHIARLFYSAGVMGMKIPYSKKEIKEAVLNLLRVNKLEEGYIRPIVFYGEKMGLLPAGAPLVVAIAAWPWGQYLSKEKVTAKISKTMRIHPDSSFMDAKICGHYANSILASMEAKADGFDEALLLDYKGNIAEGPGENIFFTKGKTLVTPKNKNILPGITRDSVMMIAKDAGYKVAEKDIKPAEISKFDGAFFCGTAVEICPVERIGKIVLKKDDVARDIKKRYLEAVRGESKKYGKWLSVV